MYYILQLKEETIFISTPPIPLTPFDNISIASKTHMATKDFMIHYLSLCQSCMELGRLALYYILQLKLDGMTSFFGLHLI